MCARERRQIHERDRRLRADADEIVYVVIGGILFDVGDLLLPFALADRIGDGERWTGSRDDAQRDSLLRCQRMQLAGKRLGDGARELKIA